MRNTLVALITLISLSLPSFGSDTGNSAPEPSDEEVQKTLGEALESAGAKSQEELRERKENEARAEAGEAAREASLEQGIETALEMQKIFSENARAFEAAGRPDLAESFRHQARVMKDVKQNLRRELEKSRLERHNRNVLPEQQKPVSRVERGTSFEGQDGDALGGVPINVNARPATADCQTPCCF